MSLYGFCIHPISAKLCNLSYQTSSAADTTDTALFKHFKWFTMAHTVLVHSSHFSVKDSVQFSSVQFISVTQSCLTLCDPINCSTPGLPVHQLPEFTQTQTHIHRVSDAFQPSHPLSSHSPPASNPSQHQSLFQWVNSSHEVAKVLEFQL